MHFKFYKPIPKYGELAVGIFLFPTNSLIHPWLHPCHQSGTSSPWRIRIAEDLDDRRTQAMWMMIIDDHILPIGSMYAIYGNIYHQYTPNELPPKLYCPKMEYLFFLRFKGSPSFYKGFDQTFTNIRIAQSSFRATYWQQQWQKL